jgi:hypothetical protein
MTMPQQPLRSMMMRGPNAERGHRAQRWASTTMLAGALQRAVVLGSRADSFSPPSARVKGGPKKLLQDKSQPENVSKLGAH